MDTVYFFIYLKHNSLSMYGRIPFFQRNVREKMKHTFYFQCSLSVDPSDVSSAKDFSFLFCHFIACE